MGKSSSQRKVSKVARTGGGKTARTGSRGSWIFPTAITAVVVMGVILVAFSRQQREPDTSPPRLGDHWHAAVGFNLCGSFLPNLDSTGQAVPGIHTHDDGVAHVHPSSDLTTGSRAVFQVFLDDVGAVVTEDSLSLPGQETRSNGDLCGDQPGEVQVWVWDDREADTEPRRISGNPGDLRLEDNQLITVAFVPEDAEITRPPSESQLDQLTDVPGATTPTTIVGPQPETTTTVGATTTTSSP